MTKFDLFKAISYGVLVWAAGGLALWALTATTLSVGWTHGIVAVVIGITAYLLSINAKPEDVVQALGYGVVFAAVGLGLDAIITRTLDAHIFNTWQYYIGYALVLLAPLFRTELPNDRILSAR